MRIATIAALSSLGSLASVVAYAYMTAGAMTAVGLVFIGCITLLEAFRQADRRFIAPLQARCQDDYNRQIEALLGPLLEPRPMLRAGFVERVDA
jgi:hypothetical protein